MTRSDKGMVLIISLLFVLMGVVGYRLGERHAPVVYQIRPGDAAETYCDLNNEAVTIIDSRVFESGPDMIRETMAHEQVHRAQLLGDCNAGMAHLSRSAKSHLEAEAQAYCIGLLTVADIGTLKYLTRRDFALQRLTEGVAVPDGLTVQDADEALVNASCE